MAEQPEKTKREAKQRQAWSQRRNTLRFRLGGAVRLIEGALEQQVLTPGERREIERVTARLRATLRRWPKRNEKSKAAWLRERA